MAGKVHYFHMGCYPLYLGFCTDPAAFAKEIKRLKVEGDVPFLGRDSANATLHAFECNKELNFIICMDPKGATQEQIAALLAHEAVHAAQVLWESIGETRPGEEAEAYLVQYIVQNCLLALKEERKKGRK